MQDRDHSEDTWVGEGVILFVDDMEVLRRVCTKMLERFGYSVLVAASGSEAIELYREHHQNLVCVLLDLKMPGIDGHECFEQLKAVNGDTPIVLMSAIGEHEVARLFTGASPEGFLQKPFEMRDLGQKLKEVMG
jgi:two-component system cell cycle sensor histidine kinase/response regulator CckA